MISSKSFDNFMANIKIKKKNSDNSYLQLGIFKGSIEDFKKLDDISKLRLSSIYLGGSGMFRNSEK